jgi:hypothetical protein
MPSKYRKLTSFLSSQKRSPRTFQFEEIEAILGFALPRSAFSYPAWWSNQTGDGHSQNLAWRSIGWRTANLNLGEQRVTFVRDGDEPDDERIDLSHVVSVLARLEKSRQASTEPSPVLTITALPYSNKLTPVITNEQLWKAVIRAATRDLEDFVKRYADLRQQPMLEEVFEKIEEAVRRLRTGRTRIVHRRPSARSGETPNRG